MKRISSLTLGTLFLLITLFLPLFSFAQPQPATSPPPISTLTQFNIFNPPAIQNGTDISIGYLGNIFGVVDGVLHGGGTQIMGHMFMVFNAGALILGGIIVIYTTLISLINTAHEGQVLGKKWHSMWVPLRTVMGIALLVPKASGYCAIQIFMMWVIVQGVALADTIWGSALIYLAQGGVVIQQALTPQADVSEQVQNAFRQTICLAGLQTGFNQAYQQASQANLNPPPVPNFLQSVNPLNLTCDSAGSCSAQLPYFSPEAATAGGFDWSKLNGACGTVSWVSAASAESAKGLSQNLITDYQNTMKLAVQQMLIDTLGPAQQVVNQYFYPSGGASPNANFESYLSYQMLLTFAEDYQGLIYPLQNLIAQQFTDYNKQDWMLTAGRDGWMNAGSYYTDMSGSSSSASKVAYAVPELKGDISSLRFSMSILKPSNYPSQFADVNFSGLSSGLQATDQYSLNSWISNAEAKAQQQASTYGGRGGSAPEWLTKINSEIISGLSVVATLPLINLILKPFIVAIIKILAAFGALATAQQTNYNPVVLIAVMGGGLLDLVTYIWAVGAASFAAATGALAAIPFLTESNTVLAVMSWINPFLWSIAGLMFIEGIIMVFYVPMIPYLLFLFGAVGWLFATVEAMVAAPIVALGVTHPEGQEVLGKADPAVMLLVNVFLRPSMMIIGFIAGIILSFVSIWFLNQAFFSTYAASVWSSVFGGLSPLTILFSVPFIIIFYVIIVIGLLNYCFSLVNVLPDKVMRWIGGQAEGVSEAASRMLGETRGGVQEAGKGIGSGAQEGLSAAGKRADQEKGATGEVGGDKGADVKAGSSKKADTSAAAPAADISGRTRPDAEG